MSESLTCTDSDKNIRSLTDHEDKTTLKEGHFYTVIDGKPVVLERDPDDTLRKVRLMQEAIETATKIQKKMRKLMNGYKPDLTLVCSALVAHAARNEDEAELAVAKFFRNITLNME
jgi:hypothetical protein